MHLTTKGRYAVRALIDMALCGTSQPISLAEISKRQNISQSYLEQLFMKLRQKKLVKSVRGPGGGYLINKPLNEISMAQIINIIDEESLDATSCCGKNDCQNGSECLTHQLWKDLTQVIYNFLNQITLFDLIERFKRDNVHAIDV